MKKGMFLMALAMAVSSCAGYSAYHYRQMYALVSPVKNYEQYYEDRALTFQFEVLEKKVLVQVVNRGTEPVEIDWPAVHFIDSMGVPHTVANDQTLFTKDLTKIKPTVVAGGKTENNVIVPADNIQELEQWTWYLKPFYNMEDDTAVLNLDKTFHILLPVNVGKEKRRYNFQFAVVNVVPYHGNTPG